MSDTDKMLIDDLTGRVIKARALVAKWRADETDSGGYGEVYMRQCADELAAAVGEPYIGGGDERR